MLVFFRSNASDRYFWLPDQGGTTFTVRDVWDNTVITTYQIQQGECNFYWPGTLRGVGDHIPTRRINLDTVTRWEPLIGTGGFQAIDMIVAVNHRDR